MGRRSRHHYRCRPSRAPSVRVDPLVQPGRQIFVYGERGVGKTSLAQTAAFEHQTATNQPILLACDPGSTFARLAHEMAVRLYGLDPTITKRTNQVKGSLSLRHAGVEAQRSTDRGQVPEPKSVNEAVTLISHAVHSHSDQPVIVMDEFERIRSADERALFADFIKQAGDQSVPLKLIFCGVGGSLAELLDTHHSCYRYLVAVQLDRLGKQPCLEIIDTASSAIGVQIEDSTRYRIAMISDGFPHYVHLITEKLLWQIFEDLEPVTKSSGKHYLDAIRNAVHDIEPKLKATYERATLKYSDSEEYEAVLWAVADHHELKRRSSDIYETYRRMMWERELSPIPRDKFNQRMNALKRDTHSEILKGNRQGWYEFREAVMRGYVRLRAEEMGVQLGADHPAEYRGRLRLKS